MFGSKEQITPFIVEGKKAKYDASESKALWKAAGEFDISPLTSDNYLKKQTALVKRVKLFLSNPKLAESVKKKFLTPKPILKANLHITSNKELLAKVDVDAKPQVESWETSLDTWHTKKTAEPLFAALKKITQINFSPLTDDGEKIPDVSENHLIIGLKYLNTGNVVMLNIARGENMLEISFSDTTPIKSTQNSGVFEKVYTINELQDITIQAVHAIAKGVNKITSLDQASSPDSGL